MGSKCSLQNRLRMRELSNLHHGRPTHFGRDALDCYLDGMSIADIAHILDIKPPNVRKAIRTEALLRLMEMNKCENIEDLKKFLPSQH